MAATSKAVWLNDTVGNISRSAAAWVHLTSQHVPKSKGLVKVCDTHTHIHHTYTHTTDDSPVLQPHLSYAVVQSPQLPIVSLSKGCIGSIHHHHRRRHHHYHHHYHHRCWSQYWKKAALKQSSFRPFPFLSPQGYAGTSPPESRREFDSLVIVIGGLVRALQKVLTPLSCPAISSAAINPDTNSSRPRSSLPQVICIHSPQPTLPTEGFRHVP